MQISKKKIYRQFTWVKAILKSQYFVYFTRFVLGLILSLVILNVNLDKFEFPLYDLRIKYQPYHSKNSNIVILKINQNTVSSLNRIPNASDHESLLRELLKHNPKFIIYSLPINEIKGTKQELARLSEAMFSDSRIRVISNELEMKDENTKKVILPSPFELVVTQSGPITRDKKTFAQDGATRRAMVTYQEQPMIHYLIAQEYNPEISIPQKIRGSFEFYDSHQVYVKFQEKNAFKTIEFQNLIPRESNPVSTTENSDNSSPDLSGKVVIIGTDLLSSFEEYALTPISDTPTSVPLAEVHANIIHSLVANNGIIQAPYWLNLLLIILITILVIEVVLSAKPLKGLLILASTLLSFTLIACLSFWVFGFWINMVQVYLSIFLTYYFFIPYRLIKESRKSWEYYQKHKLLKEVEELKTNFISMMSHDLKTPIARILGMTELISKDPAPLSTPQREALDTIKASSDDLLKFINSILQYGRIESEGIHLNLQSKDINNLIEEVIRKHEFLARLKQIQIQKNLEPLFPIQVDSDLIKQVLSNLIENAIKYSPEKTIIQVNSSERNDRVFIQVVDQGEGIPEDELNNIFMKFFRSKNAKNSPVKGSGLGLYLAKYFTELHQGSISASSIIKQGSVFTVELPMAQKKG